MMTARDDRRGAALVVVLLVVTLLAVLVLQFVMTTGVEVRQARNIRDDVRCIAAAKSAVTLAKAILVEDLTGGGPDTLKESWATERDDLSVEGLTVSFRIVDEASKLNLARLVERKQSGDLEVREQVAAQFARLAGWVINELGHEADPEELAEALVDWVDEDNEGRFEEGAPNRTLAGIEELRRLPGMDPLLFYGDGKTPGLRDLVTVWSDGLVNVNTAPAAVLGSLSDEMDLDAVDAVIRTREDPEIDFSDRDTWHVLAQVKDISAATTALTCVSSNVFSCEVTVEAGALRREVRAILRRSTAGVETLVWREGIPPRRKRPEESEGE